MEVYVVHGNLNRHGWGRKDLYYLTHFPTSFLFQGVKSVEIPEYVLALLYPIIVVLQVYYMFLCLVVATCPFSCLLFGLYGSMLQYARGEWGGGGTAPSLHVSKTSCLHRPCGYFVVCTVWREIEMAVKYWKWQLGLLCIVCIFNELYEHWWGIKGPFCWKANSRKHLQGGNPRKMLIKLS